MERARPIHTQAGIITGRNALFIQEIEFDIPRRQVSFFGQINPACCSAYGGTAQWLDFDAMISKVVAVRYADRALYDGVVPSCFGKVEQSRWKHTLGHLEGCDRLSDAHAHYVVAGRDIVAELMGGGHEFNMYSYGQSLTSQPSMGGRYAEYQHTPEEIA